MTPQPNAQPDAQPQPGAQPQGQNRMQMVAQRLTQAAQQMIYSSQQTVQQILQIVRQAKDPVQGIVQATMLVLHHMLHQVKGVDPKIVYLIGPRVALMIAELCVKAKIIPDDAKFMEKVLPALKEAVSQEIGRQQGGQPPQGGQPQPGAPSGAPQPAQGAPKPAGLISGAMGG